MKQLLAIQAVLFFGNGLLKKPLNWWLICCPLLAYAAYEVIYYVWEEQRLARLDRERKQQRQTSTINRAKLKDELNKNLN